MDRFTGYSPVESRWLQEKEHVFGCVFASSHAVSGLLGKRCGGSLSVS